MNLYSIVYLLGDALFCNLFAGSAGVWSVGLMSMQNARLLQVTLCNLGVEGAHLAFDEGLTLDQSHSEHSPGIERSCTRHNILPSEESNLA